jgi:predicted kinase
VERLRASLGNLPRPVARPALVAVSGLPGTGKSRLSQQLAERLPFVILESDALRRALFPRPDYSRQESFRLFKAVHLLTEKLLKEGIPVIIDATNLTEGHREYLYAIANKLGARLIMVHAEAPPEVVRKRLAARGDEALSEADWDVYLKLAPTVENIKRRHYVVDTSEDTGPVLDKIIAEIQRQAAV